MRFKEKTKSRIIIDIWDFDENGHLNNGAYPRYFEFGRLDLLREFRLNSDPLGERNISFLVERAIYYYHKPIEKDGEVEIHSGFLDYNRKARLTIHQEMFFNEELTTIGDVDYFFYDLIRKKPIKPPEDIIKMLFD